MDSEAFPRSHVKLSCESTWRTVKAVSAVKAETYAGTTSFLHSFCMERKPG